MGYKRVERNCDRCGAPFLAHKPSQVYCSRSCAALVRMPRSVCSIEGCDALSVARTWCDRHYSAWKRTGDPMGMQDNPERRFWLNVRKSDGCWEWTGSLSGGGYGQFRVHGKQAQVHRFAYGLLVGPVPEGLELDHLCRNRRCVNPAHLEPVTRSINVARGIPFSEKRKPKR